MSLRSSAVHVETLKDARVGGIPSHAQTHRATWLTCELLFRIFVWFGAKLFNEVSSSLGSSEVWQRSKQKRPEVRHLGTSSEQLGISSEQHVC